MLEKKILDEIIGHTKFEYPKEACGIIVRKDDCFEIYKMINVSENPLISYLLDSNEQIKLFKKLDKESSNIFAIYHSHPFTEAYPSPRDVELAFYQEAIYIIISLKNFQNPDVGIFTINDGLIKQK